MSDHRRTGKYSYRRRRDSYPLFYSQQTYLNLENGGFRRMGLLSTRRQYPRQVKDTVLFYEAHLFLLVILDRGK